MTFLAYCTKHWDIEGDGGMHSKNGLCHTAQNHCDLSAIQLLAVTANIYSMVCCELAYISYTIHLPAVLSWLLPLI